MRIVPLASLGDTSANGNFRTMPAGASARTRKPLGSCCVSWPFTKLRSASGALREVDPVTGFGFRWFALCLGFEHAAPCVRRFFGSGLDRVPLGRSA